MTDGPLLLMCKTTTCTSSNKPIIIRYPNHRGRSDVGLNFISHNIFFSSFFFLLFLLHSGGDGREHRTHATHTHPGESRKMQQQQHFVTTGTTTGKWAWEGAH